MNRLVYYNENDKKAATWLKELIDDGQLPKGDVDERSIEDVKPDDIMGYEQCHFFAGIGGWPLALRWAGWSGPVWTGSCPCQPFSSAGKRVGVDDPRHLWPAWRWLIDQCRPVTVFGEQVASKDGREWLAGVRSDLDILGYVVGAADLPACGVGAPHIRQRLWWVADSAESRLERSRGAGVQGRVEGSAECSQCSGMGYTDDEGLQGRGILPERVDEFSSRSPSMDNGMADADSKRCNGQSIRIQPWRQEQACHEVARGGPQGDTVWIHCSDGKARRIEPGIEPLANGVSGRVGLLRGYGNAIVPQVAKVFVEAFMQEKHEGRTRCG